MGQLACLEKMTLVKGRGRFAYRARAFEAPTSPFSVRSNDDKKDLLGANKPGPSEAPSRSGSGPLEALSGPF